jgi:DNA-directed RNA polymerase specialized sigma24 family protein
VAPLSRAGRPTRDENDLVRLRARIEALPERLQIVLSLHYLEGLRFDEIALVLDEDVAEVERLNTHAIGLLDSPET